MQTANREFYPDAVAHCQSFGGHVATITSSAEQSIVIAMSGAISNDLWLGMTDEAEEGDWVLVDGRDSTFFPWALNNPVYSGPNCAIQLNNFGSWSNVDCTGQKQRFVCQRGLLPQIATAVLTSPLQR